MLGLAYREKINRKITLNSAEKLIADDSFSPFHPRIKGGGGMVENLVAKSLVIENKLDYPIL